MAQAFIPQELRTFAASNLTTSYQLVGSLFSSNVQLLRITNTSNRDIDISFDGVTDHDIIAENAPPLELQIQANGWGDYFVALPNYMGVHVKAASAGTGNLYVATYGINF